MSPLPYPKKKKKSADEDDGDVNDKKNDDKLSNEKTENDASVSKDNSKKDSKKAKRPLGKNGRPLPRKGATKTVSATRTDLDEELHPELLKIHKKKRLLIQCISAAVLLILGGLCIFGIWEYKHKSKKKTPTSPVIPTKVVDLKPMVTTPKPKVDETSSTQEASLADAFKALRRKERVMDFELKKISKTKGAVDASKNLEIINKKIKLYQDFINENEKDHPGDPIMKKAHDRLNYLESMKNMYQ